MAERKALVRFQEVGASEVQGAIEKTAASAERASERSSRAAERIGKTLGVALAAGATGAALLLTRAIQAGDGLDKMSERTGIAVETLSRFDAVARMTDTSLDSVQKGLQRLATVQFEAAKGGEAQIAMLEALGIRVDEIGKLAPDEVLMRVADAFASVEDPAMRSALASEVFGRNLGNELIPLLSEGSDGLKRMMDLSDRLGYTMSKETAEAMSKLVDEITIMQIGMDGIFRKVADDLLPTMQALAEKFNDPAFREGIEALISGAARAVIKLVELGSELGNVARWAGEEVASMLNGPGAQDLIRTEQQLERVEATLARIKGGGDLRAVFEALSPNRVGLDIRDLGGSRDDMIAKLEAEAARLRANLAFGRSLPSPPAEELAAPDRPDPSRGDAALKFIEEERRRAEARRNAAAAAREAAEAERELMRLMEEQAQAAMDFRLELEDLAAAQGGPVAERMLQYQRDVLRLNELHEKGKVSVEDLTKALALLTEQRDADVKAIEARRTPAGELLESLREEAKLLRMTRLERSKYGARQAMGDGATPEELAEADSLIEENDRLGRIANGLDDLREAGTNMLFDWAYGAKSFGDAAEDALDGLRNKLIQMAAEQLIEQIFGQFGTTGPTGADAGGPNGWFGQALGWLGGLFGGGSAKGNAFLGGSRVEAFELGGIPDGPQMFPMAGGRWGVMNEALDQEAILPLARGRDGRLGVHAEGSAGGGVYIGSIVLQGETDRKSAGQRAHELGVNVQRELARSGR